MGRATEGTSSAVTDALWLDTLHRICARAAHELKGALNGVAVNLEVVRSRAEKPDVPASKVSKFANAAVDQLGAVITMTEALLVLSRPMREPVELGSLVVRVGDLVVPAARADGRRVTFEGEYGDLGVTSASGSAACLAVGWCLLAAVDASSSVRCSAVLGESEPGIRIEMHDGDAPPIDPEIAAATADAGIRIVAESSAISITFPR
ncbi:MAG: hypothetical protein JWM41_4161 [Gemmatimonadetes bacterium]|nr:hypothetical protein [Gemmatimonadota bacterium]